MSNFDKRIGEYRLDGQDTQTIIFGIAYEQGTLMDITK